MPNILVFDSETTGICEWKKPSDDPTQPYLVQIAALLVDISTWRNIAGFVTTIKPADGWTEMPDEAEKIHGISYDYCVRNGIDVVVALQMFDELMGRSDVIVGHNVEFDKRILRIASKRNGFVDFMGRLKEYPKFDTCREADKIAKLPATVAMHKSGRHWSKLPKLTEAYEFFYGEPPKKSHEAMADVVACMRVYKKIIEWHAEHGEPVTSSKAKAKPKSKLSTGGDAKPSPAEVATTKSKADW